MITKLIRRNMPVVQVIFGMADNTRDKWQWFLRGSEVDDKVKFSALSCRLFAYSYIFFITIPGLWKCIPPLLSKKRKRAVWYVVMTKTFPGATSVMLMFHLIPGTHNKPDVSPTRRWTGTIGFPASPFYLRWHGSSKKGKKWMVGAMKNWRVSI